VYDTGTCKNTSKFLKVFLGKIVVKGFACLSDSLAHLRRTAKEHVHFTVVFFLYLLENLNKTKYKLYFANIFLHTKKSYLFKLGSPRNKPQTKVMVLVVEQLLLLQMIEISRVDAAPDFLLDLSRRHVQMNRQEALIDQPRLLQLKLSQQLHEPLERVKVSIHPYKVHLLQRLAFVLVIPAVLTLPAGLQRAHILKPQALQDAGKGRDPDATCY